MGRNQKNISNDNHYQGYPKGLVWWECFIWYHSHLSCWNQLSQILNTKAICQSCCYAYLTEFCKALVNKFCPFFFVSFSREFKLWLKHHSDKARIRYLYPSYWRVEKKQCIPLQLNNEDKTFYQNGKEVWILIHQNKGKYLLQYYTECFNIQEFVSL